MKASLHLAFSIILAFFTLFQADLKANPDGHSGLLSFENPIVPYATTLPADDDPCNGPGWQSTNNITQTSAIFQWESCYGSNGYSVQWRYPNGSWYDVPGTCYNNWINVGNYQPCTSYEWRVRSHCNNGYYSSWCYPVVFSTLCNVCQAPYDTYTSDITDHSATLHWSEVWGAQGYTVEIRWPSGSWTTLYGSPCQNTWITVSNLQPGTSYDWRVRANCNYYNYSDWTYGWFATTYSYNCQYPDWLQCYNITDYSATWKWGGVPGSDYYMIQWCNPGGSWYDLPGGPFYGTWVNVNNLNSCLTYQWRVKSYCHYGGWSNWCNPNTFSTSCHSCAVPTGLITIDIGDNQATLKWAAVYGAGSYSVQMQDQWGSWYNVPGSPTSGVWIKVLNLWPCKSYVWRVRANCNYDNYSYWSKPKQFTTTCSNGCYAPQWVYTSGITNTSATLKWATVNGADYYVVEWRIMGGTWSELPGGPITNPWVELTGLHSTSMYEWHVKCHCISGYFSGWSPQTSFVTLGSSCGLPMFRYTSPITESTATFNWSNVPGALNYTIQIHQPNGAWTDVMGSPTTATSLTATGLQPNTQYEWRMQVNCSNGGYSDWLSAIMFTTGTSPGCSTPGSLYTDNITLNGATLHWSSVDDSITYTVEIRVLPNGAWTAAPGSPAGTNVLSVDGLNSFTTYEWHVRANCKNGNHSFWSGPVQFTTTNAPPCNPPDSLLASGITENTALFSWMAVSGGAGYQVQIRLPNGVWIDLPGGGVTDAFVLANGFTPNTTYEWRVRTQCDSLQYSDWSPSGLFTTDGTGPSNDDCANAIVLPVGNTCVTTFGSNIGATASLPPPVGGCWSNEYKDVWFKFTMPDVPNPAVTIRTGVGSLGNAVMEVYSGTDCSILSVIACEDNNDNGNGSSMPVINLTGTANATIWVRVWGFDGATGTFTICVFNGISFNYGVMPEDVDPAEGNPVFDLEKAAPALTGSNSKPELHVSPNPVSDQLDLEVLQTEECRVVGLRISDLSGKTRFAQDIEPVTGIQFRTGVDVSSLVPGMYVLQVQTTTGMIAEKISVIK